MSVKELTRLIRQLEEQGWHVEATKSGWMAYSPDGINKTSIHKTPSDHRAWKNLISNLRKGGFDPDA